MLPFGTFAGVRRGKRLRSSKSIVPTYVCDPVLVPTNPSYPGVAEHHFARVGGTIEELEVGIVDVDRNEVQWVSLETDVEGFYLGQVDWVPNSNVLLIETLSRFRDKREFWLTAINETVFTARLTRRGPSAATASIPEHIGFATAKPLFSISEKEGWRQAYVCSRDGKRSSPN